MDRRRFLRMLGLGVAVASVMPMLDSPPMPPVSTSPPPYHPYVWPATYHAPNQDFAWKEYSSPPIRVPDEYAREVEKAQKKIRNEIHRRLLA